EYMLATIEYNSKKRQIDLSKPLDISIPLRASESNVNAWYLEAPRIEAVKDGEWVASVAEGADINFNNIWFNPHAHGTHTECVGHITEKVHSINESLKQFYCLDELITVAKENKGKEYVIYKKQHDFALGNKKHEALIIRTNPNTKEKLSHQYSHTKPPYLLSESPIYLREKGIK